MKVTASIVAHKFDSLPGHVQVTVHGKGSTKRVALQKAIGLLFKSSELKHKRIESFNISVVITQEAGNENDKKAAAGDSPIIAKGGASAD